MANSISSELTIATAVSTLGDLLAPISNFTLNINNDVVGRSSTVKVPVISTSSAARDFASATGYGLNADSEAETISVDVVERIKPFHLSDNEMNKSPLTLQSYVKQNAHEFGRYLMRLIFDGLDATTGDVTKTNVAEGSVTAAHIKGLLTRLDGEGAPLDRHLILAAAANSGLMPETIETFGQNVLEGGRFNNLYGMRVYPSTVHNTDAGKVHSFAASSDAIVIVNRLPDTQGGATLEEYTPFTIEGVGIQCAYRRYYDASKGEHFGAFTTNYGVGIAKPKHIECLRKAP